MTATVDAASELWIRRFHPVDGTRARLVCFPHAGGSASFFFPLAKAFAGWLDVMAVQYPGRQDRRAEPPIDDIHRMADSVAAALVPLLADDVPFAVLGHSMGAALAYETALRLQDAGTPVPLRLLASGRRAPSVRHPECVHQLDDAGLLATLRGLSGTDSRMLDDPETAAMILPAVRSDYRAIETYVATGAGMLRCPVSVLAGDQDPLVATEDLPGWSANTSADLDVRVFPGGHFFLVEEAAEVFAHVRSVLSDDLA